MFAGYGIPFADVCIGLCKDGQSDEKEVVQTGRALGTGKEQNRNDCEGYKAKMSELLYDYAGSRYLRGRSQPLFGSE